MSVAPLEQMEPTHITPSDLEQFKKTMERTFWTVVVGAFLIGAWVTSHEFRTTALEREGERQKALREADHDLLIGIREDIKNLKR